MDIYKPGEISNGQPWNEWLLSNIICYWLLTAGYGDLYCTEIFLLARK